MFPNIYIKRVKPSINKMKAADLKALGFKTKAIAKTFAKLSDVTAKNYKTEHDFMEALKHKINNFKKSILDFLLLKIILFVLKKEKYLVY